MNVVLRVNNEWFGIMHLNLQDKQEDGVDPDTIPRIEMLPKEAPRDLLETSGLKKGDPVRVVFDASEKVVSVQKMTGEVLWSA